MAPTQPKSGLFVGINKGHVVTKRELPSRPSDRKGGYHDASCLFVEMKDKASSSSNYRATVRPWVMQAKGQFMSVHACVSGKSTGEDVCQESGMRSIGEDVSE